MILLPKKIKGVPQTEAVGGIASAAGWMARGNEDAYSGEICGRGVTPSGLPRRHTIRAFTLMEVMIAIGVFCIGMFAILGLVASVLRGARLLDKPMVDASAVASEIAQTNQLIEVNGVTGDLSEFLGKTYKGYTYTYDITEVGSNKLFEVDLKLQSDAPGQPVISQMSVLLYRPQSPAGSLDGGMAPLGGGRD